MLLDLKALLAKILARLANFESITTKTMTSNTMGHSAEKAMTSISLDAGTYIITAMIYRSSAVGTTISRVLFRLYAGTTIIGNHDYNPSTSGGNTYINDTFTTMVKLTTTTTITLNGYIAHSADVGVDAANLFILKGGGAISS